MDAQNASYHKKAKSLHRQIDHIIKRGLGKLPLECWRLRDIPLLMDVIELDDQLDILNELSMPKQLRRSIEMLREVRDWARLKFLEGPSLSPVRTRPD